MKRFCICFLSLIPLFCIAQEPGWTLEAAYSVGYVDYTEKGNFAPVRSDWSATAGDMMLEAQRKKGSRAPYLRVRLTASDRETETWKEQGVLSQENEMSMTAIDFTAGIKFQRDLSSGTLKTSLGLTAGYQSFDREDFVLFRGDTLIFGPRLEVTELVQTYGVGGGVDYEFPLKDEWLMGAGIQGYWLFYTYADNDGFNAGIEGNGGQTLEMSLWILKKLKAPHQSMGLRLYSDLQFTKGGSEIFEGSDVRLEWPDSDWTHISLGLFWRGQF